MSVLLFYIVLLFVFLFSGLLVAACLGIVGFLGIFSVTGFLVSLIVVGKQAWNVATSYTLIAVPLFIFMGNMLFYGGLIDRIYSRASLVASGLPGGLLHSNILAGTVFAACSGSSIAAAATFGSVGYPIQQQRGYDKSLSLGSIAAGGTLGILIPPSIPMLIYGAMTEESVGKLFMGGVIPGIILAMLYSIHIFIVCVLKPYLTPAEAEVVPLRKRLQSLAGLWQVGILVVVVLGGIYAGVATPTEVAALGASMAVFFVAASRRLTWSVLKESLLATTITTASLHFVVIGAYILSQALFYYNVPPNLGRLVSASGFSPTTILIFISIMYIIMGMFFDGISMMVLTIPFIAPIVEVLGYDLIWFGIYLTVLVELSMITPPVGLNVYVLQSATNEPIGLIFRGAVPFCIAMLTLLAMLAIFPELATWLPNLLM